MAHTGRTYWAEDIVYTVAGSAEQTLAIGEIQDTQWGLYNSAEMFTIVVPSYV